MGMLGWCYLATICNSIIIEMYEDKFWISQIIQAPKMLKYIAELKANMHIF